MVIALPAVPAMPALWRSFASTPFLDRSLELRSNWSLLLAPLAKQIAALGEITLPRIALPGDVAEQDYLRRILLRFCDQ